MPLSTLFKSRVSDGARSDSDGKRSSSGFQEETKGPIDATNTVLNTDEGEQSTLAQDGVKKAQATTIVWSRNSLIVAYVL